VPCAEVNDLPGAWRLATSEPRVQLLSQRVAREVAAEHRQGGRGTGEDRSPGVQIRLSVACVKRSVASVRYEIRLTFVRVRRAVIMGPRSEG